MHSNSGDSDVLSIIRNYTGGMKDVILFNTHFITATKNKGFITYLV
jgi:hypothetical protein